MKIYFTFTDSKSFEMRFHFFFRFSPFEMRFHSFIGFNPSEIRFHFFSQIQSVWDKMQFLFQNLSGMKAPLTFFRCSIFLRSVRHTKRWRLDELMKNGDVSDRCKYGWETCLCANHPSANRRPSWFLGHHFIYLSNYDIIHSQTLHNIYNCVTCVWL